MKESEKICYIVGAGEIGDEEIAPRENDMLIAADGGYAAVLERALVPDLVIGDFDSLGAPPDCPGVSVCPVEKDETDMALAVREGEKRGYRVFALYGGTGGRVDHTVANWQMLSGMAERGERGYLIGGGCVSCVLCGEKMTFSADERGTISVFSLSDRSEDVTISGLKYRLQNGTLSRCEPLGVSNSFLGKEACVSVREGSLLVHWECKTPDPHNMPEILAFFAEM